MNTQSPSSYKAWLILGTIVLIAVLAYFYFEGGSSTSGSTLQAQDTSGAAVGAQVLALLNQVKSVKIDTSLFSDPGYLTLRDYSVQVPVLNVGRDNPFAPLPGMVKAVPTPSNP